MKEKIDSFRGEHMFLSNFYDCRVTVPVSREGDCRTTLTFPNAEAAFQAYKWEGNIAKMEPFTRMTAKEAKRQGRMQRLSPAELAAWEKKKDDVMRDVLHAKFTQNKDLAQKLVDTGDAELVEGNTWGDRYWGVSDGAGRNLLGNLLMELRGKIKDIRKEA